MGASDPEALHDGPLGFSIAGIRVGRAMFQVAPQYLLRLGPGSRMTPRATAPSTGRRGRAEVHRLASKPLEQVRRTARSRGGRPSGSAVTSAACWLHAVSVPLRRFFGLDAARLPAPSMGTGGSGLRRIWGVSRRRQWRGRRRRVSGLPGFEGIGVTSTQADTVHSARRQTPASLLYTSKGPPIPNVDSAMGSAEAGFALLG